MKKIVFIGGGNMGEALVSGLIRSTHWKPAQITVTDVRADQLERLKKSYRIQISADNRWAVRDADIVLLAVKPQQLPHVLEEIGPVLRQSHLVISIAAGISTGFIEKFVPRGIPVIRVMPNTPALVGAGAAAIALGRWAKTTHEKAAQGIFVTVGTVVTVREDDIDAVTAVSGSGPAYLFYLAEAMLHSARQLGLATHVADALIRQTLYGSSLLLKQSHEEAQTLRQRVTSPGGTTEAAIQFLDQKAVKGTINVAIRRARQRAQQLSKAS